MVSTASEQAGWRVLPATRLSLNLRAGQLFECIRVHAAICAMLFGPESSVIRDTLAQHATLPLFLTRQLAEHSLPAAVAALDLAAAAGGQADAEMLKTAVAAQEVAAKSLQVLLTRSLAPAAEPYFQRQQAAMLRLAEWLVAALPLACKEGDGSAVRVAWLQAAYLLARLCDALSSSYPAPSDEEQQAMAWAVARCLPRLEAALPLIQSLPGFSAAGVSAATYPFARLLGQAADISHVGSCQQLRQLLAGTDAGLRIAVALVPSRDAAEAAAHVTAQTLLHCSGLVNTCTLEMEEGQPAQTAEMEAAAAAAVQLHADGCRLLHRWAAAMGTAGQAQQALFDSIAKVAASAHWLLAVEPAGKTVALRCVLLAGLMPRRAHSSIACMHT